MRRLVLVSTRRRRKNTVQIKFSDLYLGLFGLCCVNDFVLEQIFYLLQGVCFHTALCGTTMVLDTDRFGPGNRPYWEMKEGRVSSRYPDLLRTLSKARDPGQRRLLFESHRRNVRKRGGVIGNPTRRSELRGIGLSHQ